MKCFYHKTDLDGHCSGAIVKHKYPDCEMYGVDYSDSLLDMVNADQVNMIENEVVYMVDFSFSNIKDMIWLNDLCDFHWIDHHKSAIEKMDGLTCRGKREIGKAGCELTWEYVHPETKIPFAVKLLGRYDVWDHKDELVLPFQYGFRMFENTLPESPVWKLFLAADSEMSMHDIEGVTQSGNTILAYQKKQDEIYAKGMSFEVNFEGLRAIAVNKAFCNSKIFDSVYKPENHDIMIIFGIKKREYKVSLYSLKENIDVSVIAQKFGGGGHKGAAGFYINEYPF
jgi:oligoribonuclease NrnB/cAMP/cGMP phosphodiesterase (DHH superfamily)